MLRQAFIKIVFKDGIEEFGQAESLKVGPHLVWGAWSKGGMFSIDREKVQNIVVKGVIFKLPPPIYEDETGLPLNYLKGGNFEYLKVNYREQRGSNNKGRYRKNRS